MREAFDCHWKGVYIGRAENSVVCKGYTVTIV